MSIDPTAIRLESHSGGGRYVHAFDDGTEAELVFFERPPGAVTITHTGTPPSHRRQGVAAALVAHAVADFRAAGKTVTPACPFARSVFEGHPEWADLLARR